MTSTEQRNEIYHCQHRYKIISIMRNLLIVLAILITVITGCKKDDSSYTPGEFVDYGYVSTASSVIISTPAQMIYHQGKIFVASNDGVWKISLTDKIWRRAGLDGKKVNVIYNHPTIADKFFAGVESTSPTEKSLYISTDAGANWQAALSPVFDTRNNKYESFFDIRMRPGHPNQIFANLGASTIAVSKDGGNTWNRQNYRTESFFGIDCVINFLEGNPNEIFQGAEQPLDQAWLGKYTIDASDPVILGNLQQVIGGNYEWGNSRPNCLETFNSNPGVLYIGMEGPLTRVEGTQWKYLHKSFAYIKGIWLNSSDKKHLIFGGGVNGTNTSLALFETYDEGATVHHISDKLGMVDPDIIDIVATDTYPALLIRDNENNRKMKLVIYKPGKK